MHIVDNRDVCAEVICYFSISLTNDAPDDIRTKRHVLLSLALATQKLTDIALDELWKSMITLEPIVQIFNSSSTSNNASIDTVLRYVNGAEHWVN
jgi:hypothetical protein